MFIAFIIFLILLGIISETVRGYILKTRHGMTREEYWAKKVRGEKVPDL